tara:strand:- start:1051 stop:1191 length:141 start_codon:yes stop_codon:yes gene_type:complete
MLFEVYSESTGGSYDACTSFCVPNWLLEIIQGVEFKGRIKQLEKAD